MADNESEGSFKLPGWGVAAKFKPGPGALGQTAPVAIFAALLSICGVAAFAFMGRPELSFACFVIGIVASGAYVWKAFDYSEKHPGEALTDGSEFVAYTAMMQGAKDPNVIEGTAVPTANTEPPIAI